ncbi:DUF4199 domain-containing protein [uncultured Mucilaginibacter sp.]|uniref:DUF4199 domain-containing protein n=1 Tax=uncultured Mucilaginibacter sp. TaxID=797541 RepID=UPI0025DBD4DB|nr:DUF4199 domain-containing protein [uncultured Mucilaginibacter sp.]
MDINLERKIKLNGVKNGLLLGIVYSAIEIFYFYYITKIAGSALLLISGRVLFPLVLPILGVIYFCLKSRKQAGGFWTFKQATTGIFIMLCVAYIVYTLGVSLLFNKVIEPNNIQKTEAAVIGKKIAIMKQSGAKQSDINAAIADTKKDFGEDKPASLFYIIFENAMAILFLFVFAILFASMIRNAEYVSVTDPNNTPAS